MQTEKTKYRFAELVLLPDGLVRLHWAKDDQPFNPLDFWIVPACEVGQAKARVIAGEFDQ